MLDETGFELAFYDHIRRCQPFLHIPAHHAAAGENIAGAMGMNQRSIRRQSFIDSPQRRQLFPGYGEGCRVETFNRLRLANDCCDCFSAIARTVFFTGKHGLVGEARNHTVAIFPRNVFGGENRLHARMRFHECLQISEAKLRPIIGAPDGKQR